ncbi:MAG: hypothetical protein Q7T33_09090 [Dehalococcoidia bacterium]|nr:hypothetical protein [Dehalococcoidia bacterium]
MSYHVISGEPCPECSGLQEVWRDRRYVEEVWGLDCPACRGTGRVLVSLAEALEALGGGSPQHAAGAAAGAGG